MEITKLLVSYEIALKLKESGFNEPCLFTYGKSDKRFMRNPGTNMLEEPIEDYPYYWINSKIHESVISAPLWQQVIDWFREEHNLFIKIDNFIAEDDESVDYDFCICYCNEDVDDRGNVKYLIDYNMDRSLTYYEAMNQAILEAIKLMEITIE